MAGSAALKAPAPGGGRATERVPLGRNGQMVSRLALGTGSSGWARESEQTQLGQRELVRVLRYGVERGATGHGRRT